MVSVSADLARAKRRTALSAAMLVTGMVCLGYASVPLYRLFCQVTGFNGTTQRAESAPGAVAGKNIAIRFDANHAPDLPWAFRPVANVQTVSIGANEMAYYEAENLSDKPVTGRAVYNVSPSQAGKYFTKIDCFCFRQQTLKPREKVRMPVVFFVDPGILSDPDARDIGEITLSYTFFPVDQGKTKS